MAVSKPLLTEFGIHHRLESCDLCRKQWAMMTDPADRRQAGAPRDRHSAETGKRCVRNRAGVRVLCSAFGFPPGVSQIRRGQDLGPNRLRLGPLWTLLPSPQPDAALQSIRHCTNSGTYKRWNAILRAIKFHCFPTLILRNISNVLYSFFLQVNYLCVLTKFDHFYSRTPSFQTRFKA